MATISQQAAPAEKAFSPAVCLGCGSPAIESFLELKDQPALIGVQWPTAEAARNCPKGDISLSWCRDCGLISNTAFDSSLTAYDGAYDNSLAASPTYRAYAEATAKRLVREYNVRNKTVVEIGSGDGGFLKLLCDLGDNHGIGFDPGPRPRVEHNNGRIRFINDLYSPKYEDCVGDLICCRQVLEHMPHPQQFLRTIREMIGSRTTVLHFDVPNAEYILSDIAVWTVIYEHPLYFTPFALWRMFELAGFSVRRLTEPFGRQFIQIDAVPADEQPTLATEDNTLARLSALFRDGAAAKIRYWRAQIAAWAAAADKVVAWGAGARGVAFFNTVGIGQEVPYIIDLNPNKHGKHIAGTGQLIVGPEFLKTHRPDVVLVMNSIYAREICAQLEKLGLGPRLFFP